VADLTQMSDAVCGGDADLVKTIVQRAIQDGVLAGDILIYLDPTTPVVHGRAALEKLVLAAERMVPAIYTPCLGLAFGMDGVVSAGLMIAIQGILFHSRDRKSVV
jgi:hypothetical protein